MKDNKNIIQKITSFFRPDVSKLVQKGIDEKMLKPVDAMSTSKSAIALVMGLLMEGWLTRKEEDWNSLFQF